MQGIKKKGIYLMINKINNNTYVGQTKDLENRIMYHKIDLSNNKHNRPVLQEEFNTYVLELQNKYKADDLYKYIDFKSYVFDNYYEFELIKPLLYPEFDNVLDIEDKYILKYAKGYNQNTNKELKKIYSSNFKKEIKESKENYFVKFNDYLDFTLVHENIAYKFNHYEYYDKIHSKDDYFIDSVYAYLLYMYKNNITLLEIEDYKNFMNVYTFKGAKMHKTPDKSYGRNNLLKGLEQLNVINNSKQLIKDKVKQLIININIDTLDNVFYDYIIDIAPESLVK